MWPPFCQVSREKPSLAPLDEDLPHHNGTLGIIGQGNQKSSPDRHTQEGMRYVKQQDITDKELADIARKKREQIENYRRKRGDPRPLKETLAGIARDRKGKKKDHRKNKRGLPEKEYILITNEFTEAMSRQYLRQYESKVLWFLIRKTWGWRKRSEFIPLRQFEKGLDILKPHVSRALSSLVKRRIVTKLGNKTYAIQSDTSLWRDKPKKKRLKKQNVTKKADT